MSPTTQRLFFNEYFYGLVGNFICFLYQESHFIAFGLLNQLEKLIDKFFEKHFTFSCVLFKFSQKSEKYQCFISILKYI